MEPRGRMPPDPRILRALKISAALVVAAVPPLTGMALAASRPVDFETRVAAQTAIERVYWKHRTWPEENGASKPPFSKDLPEAAIRARVRDSLQKSAALEHYWHRPLTSAQLQAELDRMAANTRSPEVLEELFLALGRDPALIAETLARQALADRLIRSLYAHDSRLHQAVRMKALAELAACPGVECWPSFGGDYREITWRLSDHPEDRADDGNGVVNLDLEDWQALLLRLSGVRGSTPHDLSGSKTSDLEELEGSFVVTAILERTATEIKTASVTWSKVPFETWWRSQRPAFGLESAESPHSFTLPTIDVAACTFDTWFPTQRVPTARMSHTAVWTGTEMIVWGGSGSGPTGGRYDPLTDAWRHTSTGAGVPPERYGHTAIWTGAEMIVWGGYNDWPYPTNTGGRYDPSIDAWSPTSIGANVPEGRYLHSAVWTGTEMIVWGGSPVSGALNTGGRYNPSSDTWTPTSTGVNTPSPRDLFTAVWTGREMIIWGGTGDSSGGRYDPDTDTWSVTSTVGAPSARVRHSAVWTGHSMVIWGGDAGGGTANSFLNNGGRYDPLTDTWAPTSTGTGVPTPRRMHTAVWTGQKMIVWGGDDFGGTLSSGSRYDPVLDAWTTMSSLSGPTGRRNHTAVWTGSEMIVWGGETSAGVTVTNTGGRYDPSSDTWMGTSVGDNVPSPRSDHTALWTGAEMLVWGGAYSNTGARYVPATDTWEPTSSQGAPVGRSFHTAVWTGKEMIVWGGYPASVGPPTNSGGRYDPATGAWSSVSVGADTPSARANHTGIWTGTSMIVWGGFGGGLLNSGGRYDPGTDTWARTSTGAGVPSPRSYYTAVWTGSEMIVWGGVKDMTVFNSGGRYNPITDTWTPTSVAAGVPAPSMEHSAVWTGTRMIVWGGEGVPTRGRYDPVSDSWAPTSPVNEPHGRQRPTAIWTGAEMIIWGGSRLDSGGRYNPSTDTWMPVSQGANLPIGRSFHTAVWTGSVMIIWGGNDGHHDLNDGAGYCACPSGRLYYKDADGDGYGDATQTFPSCDGTIPAGHSSEAGDCDDTNPAVHPGSLEVCNNLDDDCDGTIDDAAPPGIVTSLRLLSDASGLEWDAAPGAQSYDVVSGDLLTLHSTGGDYTLATTGCVAADWNSLSVDFDSTPEPGEGFWILVRGRNCQGAGTYDSAGPAQVGSRDAGISSSPMACP